MKFPGISVITTGPALGHDCFIDETTLEQVAQLGNENSPVKVVPDHEDSVQAVFGMLTNFRIEGDRVRADLETIKEAKMSNFFEKLLQVFPDSVGFSIDCAEQLAEIGGRAFLRLSELFNVSLVMEPAANPSGVFSARSRKPTPLDPAVLNEDEASVAATAMKPSDPPAKDPIPVQEEGGEEGLSVDNQKKDMATNSKTKLDDAANQEPEASTPSGDREGTLNTPPEVFSACMGRLLEPIHQKLDALHAKLDNPDSPAADGLHPEWGTGAGDMLEKSGTGLSSELSAIRGQLSALLEANKGTVAVEAPAATAESLAEKYAAITDQRERIRFARANAVALRSVLPRPFQK